MSVYLAEASKVKKGEFGLNNWKKWKRRWLVGTLALLLTCSTLVSGGSNAFAASGSTKTVQADGNLASDKAENTEKKQEKAAAEDIEIPQGEPFEIKKDFKGITLREKETIVLEEVSKEDGETVEFDVNRTGTYRCVYLVTPEKGSSYQLTRSITVTPREAETAGQEQKNSGSEDDEEDSDSDPEPGEDTEVTEKGVFLAVVPAASQNSRASANLIKGEDLYYPSDLGSYLTAMFHVNGKIAYCIESNKAAPPSADYIASIYESNLGLQKVLYYGYGGPGDLTGEYLKKYDDSVKYILTHLAASYSYAGAEAAFIGCYESGLEKYGVMDYISYLHGQEAPPKAALSLTPGSQEAYINGEVQRTDKFKLTGDKRNYITLTLPEKVTYHSGSDSRR